MHVRLTGLYGEQTDGHGTRSHLRRTLPIRVLKDRLFMSTPPLRTRRTQWVLSFYDCKDRHSRVLPYARLYANCKAHDPLGIIQEKSLETYLSSGIG